MKPLILLLALALAGPLSVTAAAQPIEKRMNADELERSGLNKLSQEELEFLNTWLTQPTASTEAQKLTTETAPTIKPALPDKTVEAEQPAPKADPRVAYEEAKKALNADRELVIDGEFTGWSGDTYFKFTNGEIWQQRTRGFYRKKLTNPSVKIYKNKLGFFMMELTESGRKIGVKRVNK